MSNTYSRRLLGDGINMLAVSESRFKLSCVSVSMLIPLERGRAGVRALVPGILKSACSRFGSALETRQALASMYGANLAVSADRLGDMQQLTISVTALDDRYTIGGEKLSDRCAQLLCDMILRPRTEGNAFRAEDVEREKRLLIEQIEAERNEKLYYALERCISIAGENEPFGVNPKGSVEEVAAVTPAEAYSAYAELLEKARIDIIAVGMLDHDGVAELFRGELSALRRSPAALGGQIIVPAGSGRTAEEEAAVTQTNLVEILRLPPEIDRYAARMMATCLGGTVSSLLFKRVREELSLCYYCSSSYSRSKHLVTVYSGLQPDNLGKARDEIHAQIDVIASGGLTGEDIAAARLNVSESMRQVYDSIGATVGWYLVRLLEEHPLTPEETAEQLCAVTPEEIALAAKSLSSDVTFVLTPPGSVSEPPTDGKEE